MNSNNDLTSESLKAKRKQEEIKFNFLQRNERIAMGLSTSSVKIFIILD
jgi:hypothetical protein